MSELMGAADRADLRRIAEAEDREYRSGPRLMLKLLDTIDALEARLARVTDDAFEAEMEKALEDANRWDSGYADASAALPVILAAIRAAAVDEQEESTPSVASGALLGALPDRRPVK